MAAESQERPCPVCCSQIYASFASEHIDTSKLNNFSYASRKNPEFMHLRMVRCTECDLVYAPTPPAFKALHEAYSSSAYDSSEEAHYAAQTYADILRPHLALLKNHVCAVDVGAGNGALLPKLLEIGFTQVVGIEPSKSALAAAPPDILPHMREGMFSPEAIKDISPDLVMSCMTLEHMDTPGDFMRAIHAALVPGGMAAVVVHNRKGALNRLLGLRSPIMDIEHLQLFCPNSLTTLLKRAGFTGIFVESFANTYPLKYWLRLLPIPLRMKKMIHTALEKSNTSTLSIKIPAGNILAIGIKSR